LGLKPLDPATLDLAYKKAKELERKLTVAFVKEFKNSRPDGSAKADWVTDKEELRRYRRRRSA
jgi:hypothetical protein